MCRRLFTAEFLKDQTLPHMDNNNPGIEVLPVLEPERADQKPRKRISFQCKYSEHPSNAYREFEQSAKITADSYQGKLDLVYLFCNRTLTSTAKGYQKIVRAHEAAGIETKPISDNELLDMVARYPDITEYFFQQRIIPGTCQQDEGDRSASSALRASLDAVLEKVREDHPSFRFMKPDKIDQRLCPNGVEVQLFTSQGTQAGDDTPRPVWDRIFDSWRGEKNRVVVIEGEGGIGKTVALLSPPVVLSVPAIYIHLYELVRDGQCLSVSNWLDVKMKGWAKEIDALAMREWKNGPSLLLLCDGVNEVPVVKRRDVLNLLTDWNSSHPGAQLIVVSRPLDEGSLQGKFSEAVHIKLKPISKDTAIDYLREVGQEAPDDASPVWAVLCRPLFLILYAKTGKIAQSEAEGYPLAFKEAKGPGAIIWNYLQREALRYPDAEWVLRCAKACEYILPIIAYDMLVRHAFTISMGRAEILITETLEKFDENRLPMHLASLWRRHKRVHRQYPALRSFDWEATVLDDTCLLLLLPEQEVESEDVYYFAHQNFRDCLAGVYLVNQAEMSRKDELPEVWKYGQNHLALDYAAELMEPETSEKLWETNWKEQQYNRYGYVKNHTATCTLMELQKRRKPLPKALKFSGMDLQGLSLTRYMGQRDTDLELFRQARLSNATKFERATFQSEGHRGSVTCMAIFPDGRVVSGSDDNTLRVWDVYTGQCLQTLEGHKRGINCVAILRDGRVVSGSGDNTLRVWDAASGQCLQTFDGYTDMIICIAVLPDGRVVSGSRDDTLRVWDVTTGQCLQILKEHKRSVYTVAVLPDGRVVSGSGDSTLRVWDTTSGQCLQTLEGHKGWIRCVCVLPNKSVVSGSDDNTLRVWDASSGQCLQTFEGHNGGIRCVAVLSDRQMLSGSNDGTLRVWDTATGQCLQTLEGHKRGISCLAVFPDGRVVSGSDDSTLRVWDTTSGQCLQTLKGHKRSVSCVTVLPDGRVISSSDDGTLRVWDAATGHCLQTLEGHGGGVECLAILPDGYVSGSDDSTLRVWDDATGHCLQTLKGHEDGIDSIAVLSDGRVVSGSRDNTLRVWNTATGQCLQTLEGHERGINCIAVLPDERVVSGTNNHTLRVWDVASGQCLQSLKGHRYGIGCVIALPDGRVVSGSDDDTLRVWDATTGQCQQILEGHMDWIRCVTALPDGRVVSGSADSTVRVWNASTGQCLQTLEGHEGGITCLAVLSDEHVVSGSDDSTLRVWNIASGQCLQTLEGHEGQIYCVAILPNGRVVSGSSDNTLRVWDGSTGQCFQILEGHENWITCVIVLPDRRVVSGSKDNTLRVWNVDTGKCLDMLEATEVDVSKMDFSQACLAEDLPKLLWRNNAIIPPADYERWVKSH